MKDVWCGPNLEPVGPAEYMKTRRQRQTLTMFWYCRKMKPFGLFKTTTSFILSDRSLSRKFLLTAIHFHTATWPVVSMNDGCAASSGRASTSFLSIKIPQEFFIYKKSFWVKINPVHDFKCSSWTITPASIVMSNLHHSLSTRAGRHPRNVCIHNHKETYWRKTSVFLLLNESVGFISSRSHNKSGNSAVVQASDLCCINLWQTPSITDLTIIFRTPSLPHFFFIHMERRLNWSWSLVGQKQLLAVRGAQTHGLALQFMSTCLYFCFQE